MKIIIINSSYHGALNSYNFVWNINFFKSFSFAIFTKNFMFYLKSIVFPHTKSLLCFSKFIPNEQLLFWDSCCKWLENNFWYSYVLKIRIFSSSIMFLVFHIFNTCWVSVANLFFPIFQFSDVREVITQYF